MNIKFCKLLTFSCLFLLFLVSCHQAGTETKDPRTVLLVTPISLNEISSGEYSGIIEEGKSVNASFMADGKIKSLFAKEGQRVKKGQLLAALDDSDYQIGVNQLKTQFEQMTREKKRMDEMFARHNIAPNDYEKFSAGYEQLKLQLDMAENKLSYTKLYSPSDGYVAEKFMEPGELVGAGTPVYKITDDSSLMAVVDLPVDIFIHRSNIISAEGYSPAIPDTPLPLAIESFTPDASNNMLYRMKLAIPSKYSSSLSPGMNIRIRIETKTGSKEGVKIPVRSVFDKDGHKYVWVYDSSDSSIYKKEVQVNGLPDGKYIEVSGINDKDEVVETGVKQLYEGEKVHVANNSDFGF